MNNVTNPYGNPYDNQGKMFICENRNNVYILDKQTGDVNGDKIPDTIFLVGEKGENPFYENIKVIVQDGKTMQRYVIPLYPNYSIGIDPWLFLGNFTNLNVNEIMINLPTPGSGALTYYYVISFRGNRAEYIFSPQQSMALALIMQIEVIYMDEYKVLVESEKLAQSYIVDVSDRKEIYEGTVYNEEGKLIKPLNGFIVQPHLYPVRFSGSQPYKLEALHDIAGTAHVDELGSIVSYWQYIDDKKWVLDPEAFYVMLI